MLILNLEQKQIIKKRNDNNIVNWMCRNCHIIYDKGDISINNSNIIISNRLKFSNKFNHLNNKKFVKKNIYYQRNILIIIL